MKKILYISILFLAFLIFTLFSLLIASKHVYSDNLSYPPIHKLDWIQDNAVQQINTDGTVHVEIDKSKEFNKPFHNAINEWNHLHILRLKIINPNTLDNNEESIKLHGNNNKQEDDYYKHSPNQPNNEDVLGYTSNTTNYNKIGNDHFNVIVSSNIFIMNKVSHWSMNQKTRIALHEIGHALGFDDDVHPKDHLLIMCGMNDRSNNDKLTISDSEKMTLKNHYAKYLKLLKNK